MVLDLGSGGGIDIFRASQLVGARGKAIGVDATPEMVWRARETQAKYGSKYSNVEFRLGEIEHLPIPSSSVDYVISNCVINLSPDKLAVFSESFRALKDGGVFAVADITLQSELPADARADMDAWSACLAGALTDSDYRSKLSQRRIHQCRDRAHIGLQHRGVPVQVLQLTHQGDEAPSPASESSVTRLSISSLILRTSPMGFPLGSGRSQSTSFFCIWASIGLGQASSTEHPIVTTEAGLANHLAC